MKKSKVKTPARDYQLARLMEALFFIAVRKSEDLKKFHDSEVMAVVEEALQHLDVPESKRMELLGHLLLQQSIPPAIKKKSMRLLIVTPTVA